MLPARYATFLFALILSGTMSAIVSFITTLRAIGWIPGVAMIWLPNWLVAWAIAFPTVLLVAPFTRRIVGRLVAKP